MKMKQEIAKKKAQDYIKGTGLKLDNHVLDDGEFFIFRYDEEVDHPPVAVNKETGEVIVYFPPDHADAFLKAMTLPEPLFMTNPEWYEFDEVNFRYVLTDKATDEAKKSYEEFYELIDNSRDVMDEKKIITEYFANDDDSPATVTGIEPLSKLGEHYFKVKGKDESGEFETSVFVDDDETVQILPE